MARFPRPERSIDDPHLSIVIPAYNEAVRLPVTLHRLHDYLSAQPYTWEIVVVSNGSTDGTQEVANSAGVPHVRLLSIPAKGKGIAIRVGGLAARGEIVFLCDADLSMPPEELGAFLDGIARSDIVIGSREAAGAQRFGEPSHRHVMGRLFNSLVKLLAVPGIEDTQCGFKALRRSTVSAIFPLQTLNGFAFDVEMLYLARKFGYSIQEQGIPWHFDTDTRVRPGIDSLHMLWEVLAIRVRDALGGYGAAMRERHSDAG